MLTGSQNASRLVVPMVMVALLGLGAAGGPAAQRATCQAWDETNGAGPTDLTSALDAAAEGDTVGIRGTCFGPVMLSKDVTLTRHGHSAAAILDGNGTGNVVVVLPAVHVTIDSVTLTDAGGTGNTALQVSPKGHVTLTGFTEITQNTLAGNGAAIWANRGKVTIGGHTEITDNHVLGDGSGGALIIYRGSLQIGESVKITGNSAAGGQGGGVFLNNTTVLIGGHTTINENSAHDGAGIYITGRSDVTISGSARVISNTGEPAGLGGGIAIDDERATLTVRGHAQINGNTADAGGGISNVDGRVTITGSAQVNLNSVFDDLARGGGGILNNAGLIRLAGSAQVNGNSSVAIGGGISTVFLSRVILQDEAQVTGNTAGDQGGGILPFFTTDKVIACSTWTGAISPNTPDDPPPLHAKNCARVALTRGGGR